MFTWGNFTFDKEYAADGYTKLLCHLNWLWGWPSWDLRVDDASFYGIAGAIHGDVSANPAVEGLAKGCAYFPTGNNNDYILYADNPALQITGGLTMECMLSADKLSGTRSLMEKTSSYRLYFVDGSPNVTLGFTVYIGGAAKTLTATVAESSFYYYWNHVKATYDGQTQRLYFDGQEIGNRSQTGLIDINTYGFCVGRNNNTSNQPYKGFIDEIRISNIIRPYTGKKNYSGKSALSGAQMQKAHPGNSALQRKLSSLRPGMSRFQKQESTALSGASMLHRPQIQTASGCSALSKMIVSPLSGHSKLAYFALEVNLSLVAKDSFKVIRSPLEEIVNQGHFLYQRNYRGANYSGSLLLADQDSQNRYGVREKSLELNFVRDAAAAAELGAYYFADLKNIRSKIAFRTFLTGLHLETGDHILVNYPLYNFSGELFTVTGVKFIPGSGRKKQMDLVEVEAEAIEG